MGKRRHKLEAISVEEITESPSLDGYDVFLRFRPNGSGEAPVGDIEGSELPIGAQPSSELLASVADTSSKLPGHELPTSEEPIGISQIGESHSAGLPRFILAETPVGFSVPGRRQKVHRALSAQDGHSNGEQLLYEALWTHGVPETPETRLLTIGYGGMKDLCRLDKTNCKKNSVSLIEKLTIEVVGRFDIRKNVGNTYRIFALDTVFRRRAEAGMLYVIRTSGVRFVNPSPS